MNKKLRIKIYGIANCDSVRKAIAWLKQNNVHFDFHDFTKEGLNAEKIKEWLARESLKKLLNKKSTAWRMLTAEEQKQSETETRAVDLIQQYPNLIKRPVAEISGTVLIGFDEAEYRSALNFL